MLKRDCMKYCLIILDYSKYYLIRFGKKLILYIKLLFWNIVLFNKKNKCEYVLEKIYLTAKDYDIVCFDIFDTLITRSVEKPTDIFVVMQRLYNIDDIRWSINRINAEIIARKKYNKDVNIDEIYKCIDGISIYERNKIKEQEIKLENKVIIPRHDMVILYNRLKKNGKKIWLVSDMYLDRDIIANMLNKCGIYNYDKLIVSNKINMRKDTGDVWKYISKYISNKDLKLLHIGDNFKSDYVNPIKYGMKAILIGNSALYKKSNIIGCFIDHKQYNRLGDKIIKGLIYNKKIYNSPFNKNNGLTLTCSLSDIGYIIFGPIIMCFAIWLYENFKNGKYDTIWFFAREGYYLKVFFDKISKLMNYDSRQKIHTRYFLTSRVAAATASFTNKEDIIEYLHNGYFNGTIDDLLIKRFAIDDINIEDNKIISLPRDINYVVDSINKHIPYILDLSKKRRNNYIQYIKCNNDDHKKIGVVDLGYSGTAQYYISRIMNNNNLTGFYFALSNNIHPNKLGEKTYAYYKKCKKNEKDRFPWLHLEAVLSAPYSQFLYFNEDLSPVYKKDAISNSKSKQFENIVSGINAFIDDFFQILSRPTINDFSPKLPMDIVELLSNKYIMPNQEDLDFFNIDVEFNGCKSINVINLK